jgi:hypothetical protein
MKVKFGSIIVAGSGKIGGHVVAKNRGGAYLRTKTTPTNPNTSYQAAARANLSAFATAWKLLSEANRLSWANAVTQWKSTDIFGDIKNPSGINLYTKVNLNLASIGVAALNTAPSKLEIPFSPLLSAVIDISDNETVLSFDNSDIDGKAVQVWGTPAVSQGVSFVKNQYRAFAYGTVGAGELVIAGDYASRFGTPVAGTKVFIQCRVIEANGQTGVLQSVVATVQA